MGRARKIKREKLDRDAKIWLSVRGIGKDVYASYGGGEAYLRAEREAFNKDMERREALIAEAIGWSKTDTGAQKDVEKDKS